MLDLSQHTSRPAPRLQRSFYPWVYMALQLTFTSSTLPTAHSVLNHASASCSSNNPSTPLGLVAILVTQLVYCGYSEGESPDTSTLGGRESSLEEEGSAAAVDAESDIALEVAAGHREAEGAFVARRDVLSLSPWRFD